MTNKIYGIPRWRRNTSKSCENLENSERRQLANFPHSSPPLASNDRGIFTPEKVVPPFRHPSRLTRLAHGWKPTIAPPPLWSTICHQVAGFPIFRPISPRRHWYRVPLRRRPLPLPPFLPRHASPHGAEMR